ncbi:MAG: hypothetical protein ACSHWW_04135 [Nonlabens sp.]|uniref:hypothetical protein n=1 Tax=Nonlabens sp. TaxID=1888209 RepID=UPI003EF718D4
MNLSVLFTRTLLGSMLLCASMCGCGEEDSYYLNIQGTVDDATVFETNPNGFQVNDTIFISTTIPFEFMENNSLRSIEDVEGLNPNDVFNFSLTLEKETQFGDDVRINVAPENIVPVTGATMFEYERFYLSTTRETDRFEHRFGIVLKEAGNYKLKSNSSQQGYIMSYGMYGNSTNLELYSNAYSGVDAPHYGFTVQP